MVPCGSIAGHGFQNMGITGMGVGAELGVTVGVEVGPGGTVMVEGVRTMACQLVLPN